MDYAIREETPCERKEERYENYICRCRKHGFARNVIGDCILTPELGEFDVCLFDIDPKRLDESYQILSNMNKTANGKAHITQTLDRETAFRGADFVVNAIQVGLYDPCTITDFEVPKKYGLRQTIADTLGIGGIFRALRTIPVMKSYADDMERWSLTPSS